MLVDEKTKTMNLQIFLKSQNKRSITVLLQRLVRGGVVVVHLLGRDGQSNCRETDEGCLAGNDQRHAQREARQKSVGQGVGGGEQTRRYSDLAVLGNFLHLLAGALCYWNANAQYPTQYLNVFS